MGKKNSVDITIPAFPPVADTAVRINRVIGQLENAVSELETGINEAEEANKRVGGIIEGLKSKMTAIVTRIQGWFGKHIERNQAIIDQNEVAIERAKKLQANLEKLFE